MKVELDVAVPYGVHAQCDLDAPIVVLFGPSGCGKTTVLRCLAGLERQAVGRVVVDGAAWLDSARQIALPPQARGVGMVFQDYALFPHLTVAQNIEYAAAPERRRELMRLLQLDDALAARYPREISSGQQQRVALARALAIRPRLLLLDEPLAALDAPTRERVRRELRVLLKGGGVPAIVVTHERVEALAVGDAVVVMDAGRVVQSGPVSEVFGRPQSEAVARIVGVENVREGRVVEEREGIAAIDVGGARLQAVAQAGGAADVVVCIRAESVVIETAEGGPSSGRNRLPGRVVALHAEGALTRVEIDVGFVLTALITTQSCAELALAVERRVIACIKATQVHVVARG